MGEYKKLTNSFPWGYYIVSSQSFILTKTGIKKAEELQLGDSILGVQGGKIGFKELTSAAVQVAGQSVRILSDNSESQISSDSSIYTVQGATNVSTITSDSVLETLNIPTEVRKQISGLSTLQIDEGTALPGSMAYLLGTQLLARRMSDRVVLDANSQVNARELALEFHKTLKELDISHKLYLPRYGTRVRIDSSKLCNIVKQFCGNNYSIPLLLRLSSPDIMRQFACGILDANLGEKHDAKGEIQLRTLMNQSELRRFVLHVLRLYGIKPSHSIPHYPSNGLSFVDNYFQVKDLLRMGLRFFRISLRAENAEENVLLSYSKVRDIRRFMGRNVILEAMGSGWALAADLVLLSRKVTL